MQPRSSFGLELLAGALLLGLSCTGPSAGPAEESKDRSHVYHVQLDRTEDKAKANRTLGRALEWWNERSAAGVPRPLSGRNGSPVTVMWRAPLYRIRIGPFASRAQADSVLQVAESAFPDAFVRPERLSTRRQ